jgi:hypothetical protein
MKSLTVAGAKGTAVPLFSIPACPKRRTAGEKFVFRGKNAKMSYPRATPATSLHFAAGRA